MEEPPTLPFRAVGDPTEGYVFELADSYQPAGPGPVANQAPEPRLPRMADLVRLPNVARLPLPPPMPGSLALAWEPASRERAGGERAGGERAGREPAGGWPAGGGCVDPVFVLCCGRSGSTLLRFLLDTHPDLACPPETRLPAMSAQMASVWSQLQGTPLVAERPGGWPVIGEPVLAGIRSTMDLMIGSYLARRGKRRYCDKSLNTAEHADMLLRVFPGATFICLYRHPMDVIASGIEACPWGLNGFGFDPYAAVSPGNTVLALARFWASHATATLAVEERLPERCHRVRYEDLVADPEGTADGIFQFLGVPSAPGISEACFSTERERLGPADYKIWHTSRISADSLGRGWSIPVGLIGPEVTATINDLAGKLGYVPLTKEWGIAALAPDLRQPGTGPLAADAQPLPGSRMTWSGSWPMARRLEAGLARIDERFIRQWRPYSAEAFLVTVISPAADTHARWRVDLAARTLRAIDAGRADEMHASWEIIGSAEMWEQLMSGVTNLSVAFRRRQVRYSDSGNTGPTVPAQRIGMIADLLGITTWQPGAADGPASSSAGSSAGSSASGPMGGAASSFRPAAAV
jgi:protein-tyrosine sulfotransferase